MTGDDVSEQAEKLSRPERLFKALSNWIGTGIFLVGMYYSLERGVDVHWSVYLVGGVLMGAGKAFEIAKGMKP